MVTIAELRAKHNKMSQRELAKKIGVGDLSFRISIVFKISDCVNSERPLTFL